LDNLNRIADLLRAAIKDRQVLTIGTARSSTPPGQSILFITATGLITATTTNFCYGQCLLAKVEGKWYAINPAEHREVVSRNVERFIRSQLKVNDDVFVGIAWVHSPLAANYTIANAFKPDFISDPIEIIADHLTESTVKITYSRPQNPTIELEFELTGAIFEPINTADYLLGLGFKAGTPDPRPAQLRIDNFPRNATFEGNKITVVVEQDSYVGSLGQLINTYIEDLNGNIYNQISLDFIASRLTDNGIFKLLKIDDYTINNDSQAISVALPIVSCAFAPGSPTSIRVGQPGSFVVRISVSHRQIRPLSVQCEFAGTAIRQDLSSMGDYAVSGATLAGVVIIPQLEDYVDIFLTPTTEPETRKIIELSVIPTNGYRVIQPDPIVATITYTRVLKPGLYMRTDKAWLEIGETMTVNIRRRFDTALRDAAILAGDDIEIDLLPLTLNVFAYTATNTSADRSITIPAGGETSFTLTATGTGFAGAGFYRSTNYTIGSGDFQSGVYDGDVAAPIYDLTPYDVNMYTHNRYVFIDLHRDKWANIDNTNIDWFSWYRSGNAKTSTPNPPIFGGGTFPNESTTFANWGNTYEFVQRFITQTHTQRYQSPSPPAAYDTFLYNDSFNVSPLIDLSIYRLVTGLTIGPDGTPCPPPPEPYSTIMPFQTDSFGNTTIKPGVNAFQYPAGNIGFTNSEPAVWVYAYRNPRLYIEAILDIETITPTPPTEPKIRSPWAEDPDWYDANP
jgi:hypothetical protein